MFQHYALSSYALTCALQSRTSGYKLYISFTRVKIHGARREHTAGSGLVFSHWIPEFVFGS